MAQDTTGGLFDKPAAAEYLHTTTRHVERLWAERKLSAIKVGRRVRFSKADLDQFIEANRTPAVR
jgi:excisionase family DNA binding protein